MTGPVRADTSQMMGTGRTAQEIAGQIRAEARAIDTVCTTLLGDGWRGDAANAAKEVVLAMQARAHQIVGILDQHGDSTIQNSRAFDGQEQVATANVRAVQGSIGAAINARA